MTSAALPQTLQPLHRSIVRILSAAQEVVGSGFLAQDRHILTCAHVVAEALGLTAEAVITPPQDEVQLDFPLLTPGKLLTARVVRWYPESLDAMAVGSPADIAILELTGDLSALMFPVLCAPLTDFWGRHFRAYGFPNGHDGGVWASGILRDRCADGLVQIDGDRALGYFIMPGFSGAPVWDVEIQAVLGMVVQADRNKETRAAFAIPSHLLKQAWPELALMAAPRIELPSENEAHTRQRALPRPLSSFVGRERVVSETIAHLEDPDVRLLTLTGTGGVGKTRIALEVGRRLEADFAEGVIFVDLAPLLEPSLVPLAILQALGVPENEEQSPESRLIDVIADKSILLLLDNFEHVVAAASVLLRMIENTRSLKVLATSRSPLGVVGEQEYLIVPMIPSDGVALFEQRAKSKQAGLNFTDQDRTVITELCKFIENLPLAIELAAARLKILSLTSILEGVKRNFDILSANPTRLSNRKLSLRDTFDWSYNLLQPKERELLRRLSVFPGEFTLDSSAQVGSLNESIDPADSGYMLAFDSLVDSSLLQPASSDPGIRYRMLATVKEYAHQYLVCAGEEVDVRLAFIRQMTTIAESGFNSFEGDDLSSFYSYLDGEHQNHRGALQLAMDNGYSIYLLRLVRSLWRYWLLRGYLAEARVWVDVVVESDEPMDGSLRHEILAAAASFARDQGDFERSEQLMVECLKVAPSQVVRAEGLRNLGLIQNALGKHLVARASLQEALLIHRSSRRDELVAYDLVALANIELDLQNYEQSLDIVEEAQRLLIFRYENGLPIEPSMFSASLNAMGRAHHNLGRTVLAAGNHEASLEYDRLIGHKQGEANNISALALQMFDLARSGDALMLARRGLQLFNEMGDVAKISTVTRDLWRMATVIRDRSRIEVKLRFEHGYLWDVYEPRTTSIWAESLAELIASRLPRIAVLLIASAREMRRIGDAPLPSELEGLHDRLLADAAQMLSQDMFAAALNDGSRLTPKDLKTIAMKLDF